MSRPKKAIVDGITFDSREESLRYIDLKLLQKAGEISDLKTHPSFTLLEPFSIRKRRLRKMIYTADFSYIEGGQHIIEDWKGRITEPYRMRKKLFLKKYGEQYVFRETKRVKGKTVIADY